MRDRRWPHFVAQERVLPHRHDRLEGHDWKRDIQGTRRALYAAAVDAFTSECGHPSSASPELERRMAEFGIGYDGRQYEQRHRYGRLADAIRTSLMRSRPTPVSVGGTFMKRKTFAAPTDADRTLMASLAIDFDDGAYRFEGFRYDGLSDAVNYARLMLQQ